MDIFFWLFEMYPFSKILTKQNKNKAQQQLNEINTLIINIKKSFGKDMTKMTKIIKMNV